MSEDVVLITGALAGIGRATAMAYARLGACVVVSGRDDAKGAEVVHELRTIGTAAEFYKADVRHEEEVKNLIDQTVNRFGRLDVAINNAGTEGKPAPVVEMTLESYHNVFDTNVLGVLLSMKHEVRVMLPQGKGSIVNISSAYGKVGGANASIYVASKHAVEGLTKSTAVELAGTGIRVNVVGPGPIDTGMLTRFTGTPENKTEFLTGVPLKRSGTPDEIAEAIIFVASEKASYFIGASLAVDGGWTAV